MGKLILVTGGGRSGKSTFALEYFKKTRRRKIFIATCVPKDAEMLSRVKKHKRSRGAGWQTVESGGDLQRHIQKASAYDAVIVVDCLTLYLSQLLVNGAEERDILCSVKNIVSIIKKGKADVLIVTNEVGMGIVPENKLARKFRDIAGVCGKIAAENSDEVYVTISGIPLMLKPRVGGIWKN